MEKEVCSAVLQRWGVVKSLHERPQDKRTLVENLDCSRSTVNRATRELESIGVIEYVDGEYDVTPLGETITSRLEEMMTTVEIQLELEPFLQWMPEDFDLDPHLLADTELVVPDAGNPYGVINRHVSRLKTMKTGQFLLPFVGLHATEIAHERILNHDARCEIVVAPEVMETFQNDPNYTKLVEEMMETGRFTIYRAETELPVSVGVIDGTVQIIAADGEEPRALLETDTTEVRDWATATFNEYKHQAEPVMGSPEPPKIET